jgi:hypothetical protein
MLLLFVDGLGLMFCVIVCSAFKWTNYIRFLRTIQTVLNELVGTVLK